MAHSGFEGLLAGHRLAGRYHVEEVIGRGGFAAVYRATDERLGRTVAVKVITHSAGAPELRDEIQKRFQREARAIASLHHPNVVTVYDFGTDPALGLEFLVMELLEGEVLSERLRRSEPLPVAEALRILIDAASGVDAGHRAGLVHRDIKPGNVFLARGEHGGPARVYVLDFGIARFTEAEMTQLTRSGRSFLSPAYASPEQLRGENEVTAASDVFSLAVIGYQLLAREKPFRRDRLDLPAGEGPQPLRERNPAVPAAVAAAIHRAMSEDPADRFADAGAFARALRTAAAEVEAAPAAAPAATPAVVSAPEPPAVSAPVAVPPPEPVPAPAAPPAPPTLAAAADAPVPPVRGADVTRREAREAREASASGVVASPLGARGRRRSPALLAIPLLAVLALVAWLLAGRGDRTRVAERPAPAETETASPAPAPPAAGVPGAVPPAQGAAPAAGGVVTGAGTTPDAQGPAGAAPQPSRGAPPAAPPQPVEIRPAAPPAAAAATSGGGDAAAVNKEGEALFERGDLARAAERFRRAVRSEPGNAYYRNNLGWALFQLGRVDEADRELREAVRLDPRRDIAYANIGEVERARGNVQGAIEAYERFLRLNSDPRREAIAREKLRRLRGG
jgi:tRNA A-37 threonylcarbamoyl transferase component Bud32/cytochrome c-type biogenesis protein CcmH/NrfG